MQEIKWREVPFEIMLKCDGEIKCECWLLSNSRIKYGIDLRQPMYFNEFLRQIGTHLTPLNCKSLFEQSKWYVIDDGVQPKYFYDQIKNKNKTKRVYCNECEIEEFVAIDKPAKCPFCESDNVYINRW